MTGADGRISCKMARGPARDAGPLMVIDISRPVSRVL